MNRTWLPAAARAMGLFLLSFGLCSAQYDAATVLGTIVGPSGLSVANAKISIASLDAGTTETVASDANGSYQFLEVRIGRYRIAASAAGFKATTTSPFTVTVGAHQRVDVRLEVGEVTQSVGF